jgi:hypothetical protein
MFQRIPPQKHAASIRLHAISWLSLTASRHCSTGNDGGLLRFGEHLDEHSITALMKYGLKERYPEPVKSWEHRTDEFIRQAEREMAITKEKFRKRMKDDSPTLLRSLESIIVNNMLSVFP